jgi:REP element-mobilizing transposase RayT
MIKKIIMADKFQNKYRIPSARASWWDYGSNAPYFVTICTKNRKHFFGKIVEGEMHLTEIGQSAYDCWNEIPNHFPFVVLDEFVVMPNHIHGIIIIDKPTDAENADGIDANGIDADGADGDGENADGIDADGADGDGADGDGADGVQTQNFASLPVSGLQSQTDHSTTINKFGPQSQNLASIIRGFKIGVTKFAKTKINGFGWQPRFHDHIIRNEESYQRIKNYIKTNPQNWKSDKFSN